MTAALVIESNAISVWRRGRPWLALGLFAASIAAFFASVFAGIGAVPLFALAGWFAWPAVAAASQGSPVLGARRRSAQGRAEIEGGLLRVSSAKAACALPLEDISAAWQEVSPARTRVTACFKTGWVVQLDTSEENAREWLLAAFARDRKVMTVPVGAQNSAGARALYASFAMMMFLLVIPLILGGIVLFSALMPASVLGSILCFGLACLYFIAGWRAARSTVGATLLVGAEGIRFGKLLGRNYIPFSKVASIVPMRREVVITLSDSATTSLPVSGPLEAAALTTMLRNAMDAIDKQAPALDVLDRGDRDAQTWKKALTDLIRAHDYRSRTISNDDLVRAATSAAVSPERRVAAALAIASSGDEERKAKIRISNQACLDPSLRRALELATEEAELDLAAITHANELRKMTL